MGLRGVGPLLGLDTSPRVDSHLEDLFEKE